MSVQVLSALLGSEVVESLPTTDVPRLSLVLAKAISEDLVTAARLRAALEQEIPAPILTR
jgi:hypothetical protein